MLGFKMAVFLSPVDPDRYLGTVTQVSASIAHVNLPHAAATPERRRLALGAVGDFVFIDCEGIKLLGRIIEVKIPDSERLSVEPSLGAKQDEPHPIGRIQLLATLKTTATEQEIIRGVQSHPRVGDSVFLADSQLLSGLVSKSANKKDTTSSLKVELGKLDVSGGVNVEFTPERLFGRHCGIFGATGGGKSYTLASLLHQIKQLGGQAIIFDPTGEFSTVSAVDTHCGLHKNETGEALVHFPYRKAVEDDLMKLFNPSPQTQAPKLREAMKSLKLIDGVTTLAGVTISEGTVTKNKKPRQAFYDAVKAHHAKVHAESCEFDIQKLPQQVVQECVYQMDKFGNQANFGDEDGNSKGYCEQLVARISGIINSNQLSCLFSTNGTSILETINSFLNSTQGVLRVSFKNVPFEYSTREVVMNILGRFLLNQARLGTFKSKPLIVILDEAHQFLGRSISDDFTSVRLDSFGLIAKEGRKYGLTCVLATQRPRDVPADVLSQLGTLIVHRLTNEDDRGVIEKACGDLDRNAASFVPTLSPGEAIVVGPDLPIPIPLYINTPPSVPSSKGPDFQTYWKSRVSTQNQAQIAGPIAAPLARGS
jgi:hypothetical protein